MTDGELQSRLEGMNEELKNKLENEAMHARVELINSVIELVHTTYLFDIKTIEKTHLQEGVLYTQLEQAEGGLVDAYGEISHLSVHMKQRTVSSYDNSEIFVRLPVSQKFVQTYIESGGNPAYGTYEALQEERVDAIYVQHIKRSGQRVQETFRRITPYGSVEYSNFIDSTNQQIEPPKRFFDFLRKYKRAEEVHFDGERQAEEFLSNVKIEQDLSVISEIREDILDLGVVPQKYLNAS